MDPTDDELRQMAERIIRKGDDSCYWGGPESNVDAEAVARALLARLGAGDDDEPVDEAWLVSIGIPRGGCFDPRTHYRLPYRPGVGLRVYIPGLADAIESPTRGRVRRLLVALGLSPTP